MVSYRADNRVEHALFRDLPAFLEPGDVLVINTSGTLNAALPATRSDGTQLELHLSTHLPADLWVVELRLPAADGTQPFFGAAAGETLALPAGGAATLHAPYSRDRRAAAGGPAAPACGSPRSTCRPACTNTWREHGFPIHYSYVKQSWPIELLPDRLCHRAGQRGDALGRARLHAGADHAAGRARACSIAPLHPAYRRGQPGGPRAAVRGVSTACRSRRPAGQRRARGGQASRSRSARRWCARWRRSPTRTGGPTPARAGPTWWSRPSAGVRAVNGLLTGFHEPRATPPGHAGGLRRQAAPGRLCLCRGPAARLSVARVRRPAFAGAVVDS